MKSVSYSFTVEYFATIIQPDITYAIFYLGKFNHNSYLTHQTTIKHLLCYLKETSNYKLIKGSDNPKLFQTYSDVLHGGCKKSSHSIDGYIIIAYGGAIELLSKYQLFVTLSSTKAEYVIAIKASKEIKWMKNILIEFGYSLSCTSTLFIDNKSGIEITKNSEYHSVINSSLDKSTTCVLSVS